MSDEVPAQNGDNAAPEAPLTLENILDGARVHKASVITNYDGSGSIALLIRNSRKKHEVTLSFTGLTVTRTVPKRVYTQTTQQAGIAVK